MGRHPTLKEPLPAAKKAAQKLKIAKIPRLGRKGKHPPIYGREHRLFRQWLDHDQIFVAYSPNTPTTNLVLPDSYVHRYGRMKGFTPLHDSGAMDPSYYSAIAEYN